MEGHTIDALATTSAQIQVDLENMRTENTSYNKNACNRKITHIW